MKSHTPILKDFPLFMEACAAICADNGCCYGPSAHKVDPMAATMAYTDGIRYVESVLRRLKGKTFKRFYPELPKMRFYEDIRQTDRVLEFVYNGLNDSCQLILKKLGLKPHEIWLVEDLLDNFFRA